MLGRSGRKYWTCSCSSTSSSTLGIDLAGSGRTPPATRQKGRNAAVSFEFHPPSTYGRPVYLQDARGLCQRRANVDRHIRQCTGNDICISANH